MGNRNSVSALDLDRPDKGLLFSSEPAHIDGLKYCESHHVYTDDMSKLKDVPGPSQPKTRKSAILRSEDIMKADNVASSIGQTLNTKPVKHLVEALTKELNSDLTKTRAVYRWLTLQPIRTTDTPKTELEKDTVQYLLRLVGDEFTYAQVFGILCGMVGVPCVVISGFAKGSCYEVGQALTIKQRAEWNAVLINGIWRLVDTFWDLVSLWENR